MFQCMSISNLSSQEYSMIIIAKYVYLQKKIFSLIHTNQFPKMQSCRILSLIFCHLVFHPDQCTRQLGENDWITCQLTSLYIDQCTWNSKNMSVEKHTSVWCWHLHSACQLCVCTTWASHMCLIAHKQGLVIFKYESWKIP